MLYPKKEEIFIVQKFASCFTNVQVRFLFIHRYGILLIFGGQNMKIIKKYTYPHKSQTILNTLAKKIIQKFHTCGELYGLKNIQLLMGHTVRIWK